MKQIRKIFVSILVLALILVLNACGNSGKPIVLVTNLDIKKDSIVFQLNIVDTKRVVQGDTGRMILEDLDGEKIKEEKFSVSQVRGNPTTKTIKDLESKKDYILKIQVTIKEELVILYTSETLTTKGNVIKEIYTKEELLNSHKVIDDIVFDEIKLMNDIDFDGERVTNSIGTLSNKIFNGNNKTIKNLHSAQALFGTVQSGSVIKDLTIENMVLAGTKNEDGTYEKLVQNSSASTRNYGLLASNINSTNSSNAESTVVENVKIVNSQMHISIENSSYQTSQTVYVGAIAGQFYANAIDLVLENVEINVDSANATKLYIGGLFGFAGTNSTPSTNTKNHLKIENSKVDANINFNHVNVDKGIYHLPSSVSTVTRELYIGLLAGRIKVFSNIRTFIINDLYLKGDINANIEYIITQYMHKEDDDQNQNPEDTIFEHYQKSYVGGITGLNDLARIANVYLELNLNLERNNLVIKVDDNDENTFDVANTANESLYVGLLFGENKTNTNHGLIILEGGNSNFSKTIDPNATQNNNLDFVQGVNWNAKNTKINYLTNKHILKIDESDVTYDEYEVITLEEITSDFLKNLLK